MNIQTLAKDLQKISFQKMFAASALLAFFACSLLPVFAQGQQTVASPVTASPNTGSVSITDVNPCTSFVCRQNYFMRYPYAKNSFDMDKLEPIGSSTSQGVGSTVKLGQNGLSIVNGLNSISTAGNPSAAANSNNTAIGTKQSSLNNQTVIVRAQEPMIVPIGAKTGHYLPGALPWHQPQYYNPTEIPAYSQTAQDVQVKVKTNRDRNIYYHLLPTYGVPPSDTWRQYDMRLRSARMLELAFDPERIMWAATNQAQMQGANASNAIAGGAESTFQASLQRIYTADGSTTGGAGAGTGGGLDAGALINIANEQAAVPTQSDNPWKTVPQAVWMVQQMYAKVFVPLAILFLLPGAVITQVKCQIVQGFNFGSDDATSPFEGILRSVIAVFLIPCTQVIVSYSIDVGNSMAYSVKDWVNIQTIFSWAAQLTYGVPIGNVNNAILPTADNGAPVTDGSSGSSSSGSSSGGSMSNFISDLSSGNVSGAFNDVLNALGGGGAAGGAGNNVLEGQSISENQTWLSSVMQLVFNMANYIFSSMVIILSAYQLVFMCYLYLLGPLVAAFFAWPKMPNSNAGMFKDVWGNWVNAVITVSLWRFYWMVILAIMTQRILYIQQQGMPTNLQWEIAVFTCLMGLMLYVPFNPWSFDPGAAFEYATGAGSQMMQGMSQALGNAAIAGGANPSQVQAMQGQVNQALAPMQQINNVLGQTQQAAVGAAAGTGQGDMGYNPAGTGASGASGATGAAGAGGSGTGGGTYGASAPPVNGGGGNPTIATAQPHAASAPPSAQPAPGSANQSMVAAASPSSNTSTMSGAPMPLSPSGGGSGAGVAVNGGASSSNVQMAMNDPSSTNGVNLNAGQSQSNAGSAGQSTSDPSSRGSGPPPTAMA